MSGDAKMRRMHEIELKFQVQPSAAGAVQRAVATKTARRTRLQAVYYDTPGRALAHAGVALRLRREGTRWVQTLKAGGPGIARLEHEVALAARRARPPVLDPSRHDGHPAGRRLRDALSSVPDGAAALVERYRTDVWRWHRVQRIAGGQVELAFDVGQIVAAPASLGGALRRWPVCELEIELLRGDAASLIEASRRWVQRFGLWLDVRSKAERGDRLADGRERVPARPLTPLPRRRAGGGGARAGRAAAIQAMLSDLLPNAAEVAGGAGDAGHLRQVRLGLRRLQAWWVRQAGSAHAGPASATADGIARLATALGAASASGGSPDACLLSRDATLLWLDLLAVVHDTEGVESD